MQKNQQVWPSSLSFILPSKAFEVMSRSSAARLSASADVWAHEMHAAMASFSGW